MSEVKVNKISPRSGTDVTLGDSSDTFTVPSGVGLTLTDSTLLLPTTVTATTEVKTNKISPATGTAFTLGDSGDTFTVPSGATITNSGTATGFGGDNTPAFLAYKGSDQGSISADTDTKITFTTEIFDTDGKFTSSRFTPTVAGKYFIFGCVFMTAAANVDNPQIKIYKNSTVEAVAFQNSGGATNVAIQASTILDLNTTDYVEIFGRSTTTATAYSSGTQMRFGGYKIIT